MRPADLARLAFQNLRRTRGRSLATAVGVAVGVAALVALLSYGAGVRRLAAEEFDALALYNTLRVTSRPSPAAEGPGALIVRRDGGDGAGIPLTDALLEQVGRMDGVLAAYPEVNFPVRVRRRGVEVVAGAEAVPQIFASIPAYQPQAGAFFRTSADATVLLSASMAARLGFASPEAAVGQAVVVETAALDVAALTRAALSFGFGQRGLPLKWEPHRVSVAGVLPEEGQAVSGFFRLVVPLGYAQTLQKVAFFSTMDLLMSGGASGGYAAARVQVRERDDLDRVKRAIEARGVFAASFRDQFAQLERLFQVMDLTLAIVGLIALVVAVIGIANTMSMNVVERTREIGVMKAVGGDARDVRRLFVAEAVWLGLIGGVAGVAVGWALTRLIQAGVGAYLESRQVPAVDVFYTSPLLALGALLVAVLVAALAGYVPARRAARVEPVEALRYG